MAEEGMKEEMPGDGDGGRSSKDRKYLAMLERLSALEDGRQKHLAARRADSAAVANPLESVQAFLVAFGERRMDVERRLGSARARGSQALGPATVRAELDTIAAEVAELEKLLADACYYLAAYDVQASQSTIMKLKDELSSTTGELLPKKKFSFRNKAKADEDPEKNQASLPSTKFSFSNKAKADEDLEKKRASLPSQKHKSFSQSTDNSEKILSDSGSVETIKDLCDCVIVKDTSSFSIKEVALSNLSSCKVFLRGSLRALYIHRIKDCQICVGPVAGSVLLEEIQGCVVVLASHQIRIHSASSSDFYLRLRSRPIIEHTSKVRFAPYAFHYKGLENDLAEANLSEETGMWEKVDDFRWLRAVSSPNWSIIPPHERLSNLVPPEVINNGSSPL
ncbi:hypothetical protein O6H91_02G126100 [Diphasiastrum complanatum]|nr:hypothetical protein O6H91_02G126100 [Diphasiastrum complanatum]